MNREAVTRIVSGVWVRAWWLLPLVITAVALSVFWSHATPHLCYQRYWLSGDSGVSVYNALQVAEGRTLYADIFEFKFPLFFYVWGVVLWIAGPSASAAQWTTLLTMTAVAPILAVIVRRMGANRLFATVAGVVPVTVFFASWPFSFTPWLGWLMFALAAFSLQRAFRDMRPDRGWLARAGVFTGLFVLSIQSFALPFAGGVVLGMLFALPEDRWKTAGLYIVSGLLVAVPVVVHMLAAGSLMQALDDTLIWPTTHYYDNWVKGNYPGAAIVEWFQKKGTCQNTGSDTLNSIYTASVVCIPLLTSISFLATVGFMGKLVYRRIRHGASAVITSPRALVVAVLATGSIAAMVPHVVKPGLGDMPHLSFVGVVAALPFAMLALTGPRWWRIGAQSVFYTMFIIVVVLYAHRHVKWDPFDKRFHHFDRFVERWAGTQWMEELTEPGDTIVHMPYGGWQYFTTRPSGTSFTWAFPDDRMHPKRHWRRIVDDFRERQPTLLMFTDRGLEARLFKHDPTLRERYFHNGKAWERMVPPLPHERVDGQYRSMERGRDNGVLTITQNGQQLTALRSPGTTGSNRFRGSVRGNRVWLLSTDKRQQILGHVGADGTIAGELRGQGRGPVQLVPAPAESRGH